MNSWEPYRLPGSAGVPAVEFAFNGRRMRGRQGEPLSAALLANGVRVVARSYKYRRPRGVFTAGPEEPNALVQLHDGPRRLPSVAATFVPLEPGLEASSHRGWPSVTVDVGRVLGLAAPLWAAGFYNKTFIWPNWGWYEGAIRRLAGFGRLAAEPHADPDRYEVQNAHCDVLVIGGGVAGLCAAEAAAATGARVMVVEQDVAFGGSARWNGSRVASEDALQWIASMQARLENMANAQLLLRTAAVGCYDHDVVTLLERGVEPCAVRERFWIVRTKRIVLATGAIEQPLVFANNDRPGVMLASAVHQYVGRYRVAPGRKILVATNNDSAYAVAAALRRSDIEVVGLIDSRPEIDEALATELRNLSIPLRVSAIPVNGRGGQGIERVTIGQLTRGNAAIGRQEDFECDVLAVSGGFSPTLHLYSQAGGRLVYEESAGALTPAGQHPTMGLAGMVAGAGGDLALAAAAGRTAVAAALGRVEHTSAPDAIRSSVIGPRVCPIGTKSRQWVDLLHDVTVADLELALRENYTSIEHIKRYTTLGMALDQGKTSNAVALGIIARTRGLPGADLGHTTFRPPFTPVTLGAIVGRAIGPRFAPSRLTPLHEWHLNHGGLIEDYGEWKRPSVYVKAGESRSQAVLREARAVRSGVGLFDASPLGKIEVEGPDALRFLDWFYINDLTKLAPGRVRYGLMLRESGSIFDDGTVVQLAANHFLVTTTSGAAGRVASWFEEWRQCEWRSWKLAITPVTDQWATISLSGPRARAVLERLAPSMALGAGMFPHMSMHTGSLLGHPVRMYRVSFTGELTYEINVPASAGGRVWEALMTAGASEGIEPCGLDAILALRLEKGFLHIGTDTDSTTVPADVGFGDLAARKRQDFIGRRSLGLPENLRPDRLQLVGLASMDGADIPIGAHVRIPGSLHASDGWVSSSARSVTDDQPIALAMVRGGRNHLDAHVTLHDVGRVMEARIVPPPFYDPTGLRMHG